MNQGEFNNKTSPICLHHSGIDKRLDAICLKIEQEEKLMDIKLQAIHDSISIAKVEMERRLEGMNEFRSQLSKQANEFIGKKEIDLLLSKIDMKIENLETASSERKGSKQWSDHIITALIAVAIFLIAHYVWKF